MLPDALRCLQMLPDALKRARLHSGLAIDKILRACLRSGFAIDKIFHIEPQVASLFPCVRASVRLCAYACVHLYIHADVLVRLGLPRSLRFEGKRDALSARPSVRLSVRLSVLKLKF